MGFAISSLPIPRAFFLVLAVQFLSTVADNAFLIVAIARVIELNGAMWLVPILKISFILSYVVLAPFVGPIADGFPKGRVMLAANGFKVLAVGCLLAGVDPAICIGLAGLGAAIYAPAKYGLVTELIPAANLVRANGYFEASTVSAVLMGTALGGFFVSPWMPRLNWHEGLSTAKGGHSLLIAGMLGLFVINLVATLLSLAVADTGARYRKHSFHPYELLRSFLRECGVLWRDREGGLSMAVTTLLWAVGATLQLVVLRWANEYLGLSLSHAAYLQGITAVGVIAGAVVASRCVAIDQTISLMPTGLAIGLLLPVMLVIHSISAAALLMVVVGALAGFFVVPMNALLQHRGCTLLTAGRSIAVQGFNENAGILVMLGIYAVATSLQVSLTGLVWGFSGLVCLGMLCLLGLGRRQAK